MFSHGRVFKPWAWLPFWPVDVIGVILPRQSEWHTMPRYDYLWTAENVEHIARNGVSQDEFEHVVRVASRKNEITQENGRVRIEGRAPDGRWLRCVFERIDELLIHPVTAHEISER
jgi:hypothetical protein